METIYLKNCRFVITPEKILENRDILINNSRIFFNEKDKSDFVIDCTDRIILPGLINAHTHSPMTLLRGFYDDAELHEWLNRMWSVEAKLNYKIVSLATELAIIEMLSNGITSFVDMYYFPEATAEVCKSYGIRCALGPPLISPEKEKFSKELKAFSRKYAKEELLKPVANLHAIYTIKDLEGLDEITKGFQLHMHVSETRKEVYECKKEYGLFPVELLDKYGLLRKNALLVHLGWIKNNEIKFDFFIQYISLLFD